MALNDNVDVGAPGTVVILTGIVSRVEHAKDDRDPTRMLYRPMIDGVQVGNHIWFQGLDAVQFLLAGPGLSTLPVGAIVEVTGEVYVYGREAKINIRNITLAPTELVADRETMIAMCDEPVRFVPTGEVYLITRSGDIAKYGTDRAARDAALDAMYFA